MREYLTTGQAARLCSVTPDAVLKWIKAGKIKANRTPGGHYRIHRKNLEPMIGSKEDAEKRRPAPMKSFQYCWEFNAGGDEVSADCLDCIVFRARARRCYEMTELQSQIGPGKHFCEESCDDCDYYKLVREQRMNILVVCTDQELREALMDEAIGGEYNLQFATDEYECALVIDTFRPDFLVLDATLGTERINRLAKHLADDSRVPFVRTILVVKRLPAPRKCEMDVFAVIKKPLRKKVLDELINKLRLETEPRELMAS
jgi:excisionase family DNA binding protein